MVGIGLPCALPLDREAPSTRALLRAPSMRVFLVRHGETKHNVDRRIQGPLLDDPLNDRGRAQALALERRFADERARGLRLAAVYGSPLKRAWETAEAVARGAGAPLPVRTPALVEFSWGVHLGKTETGDTLEAMKRYHADWRAGRVDVAVEGGESPAGAFARAWEGLGPLVARHAAAGDEAIAWVAHGRIFKILLARLVAGDVSRMEDFPQGNTAVTLLERAPAPPLDSGWRVVYLNDQSHLGSVGTTGPALV